MTLRRLIAIAFLLGTPKCSRCKRLISTRMMDDDDIRSIMADDGLLCVSCTAEVTGTDPWRITFVADI